MNAITKDVVIPMEDTNMAIGVKQFSLYGLAQISWVRLDIIFDIVSNEISKNRTFTTHLYGALLTGGGSFLPKIAEHFTIKCSGIESMVACLLTNLIWVIQPIMAWPYVVTYWILLDSWTPALSLETSSSIHWGGDWGFEEGNNRSKSASPSKPKKKLFCN